MRSCSTSTCTSVPSTCAPRARHAHGTDGITGRTRHHMCLVGSSVSVAMFSRTAARKATRAGSPSVCDQRANAAIGEAHLGLFSGTASKKGCPVDLSTVLALSFVGVVGWEERRGRRRGGRANHRHIGELEGTKFNEIPFHSSKNGNGRATQRSQRKATPPKGGGGRRQHYKKV